MSFISSIFFAAILSPAWTLTGPSDHKDHNWHSTQFWKSNKWHSQSFPTRLLITGRSWNFHFLESRLAPKTCSFLTGSVTKLGLFQNWFKRKPPVVSMWEDHWHIWCGGSVGHVDQTNRIWCDYLAGPWVSVRRSAVVKHTNPCSVLVSWCMITLHSMNLNIYSKPTCCHTHEFSCSIWP